MKTKRKYGVMQEYDGRTHALVYSDSGTLPAGCVKSTRKILEAEAKNNMDLLFPWIIPVEFATEWMPSLDELLEHASRKSGRVLEFNDVEFERLKACAESGMTYEAMHY